LEKEKLKMSKCFIALLWLLALLFGCMACAESTDVILGDDGPEAAQPTEGIRCRITMEKARRYRRPNHGERREAALSG
jgi:hypothetical protein